MSYQQPESLRKYIAHKALHAKAYGVPGHTVRTRLAAWDDEEVRRESLVMEEIVLNELIEQLILDDSSQKSSSTGRCAATAIHKNIYAN
jgi:hypothetical protein